MITGTLSAGALHACLVVPDGRIKCWGDNTDGQVNAGTAGKFQFAPVYVEGLTEKAKAVAAGGNHTCALTASGGVLCWGNNRDGELGDGTFEARNSPVAVVGLASGVRAITANSLSTCALLNNGTVMCWGANDAGQLGNGGGEDSPIPVTAQGISGDVQAILGGKNRNFCAVLKDGGLVCWGINSDWLLGNGTDTKTGFPTAVGNASNVAAVAMGMGHTCILRRDRKGYCWGMNSYGAFGDGTENNVVQREPVGIVNLPGDVVTLVAGAAHTCALTARGEVFCWGANMTGALGIGSTDNRYAPTWVNVSGARIISIAAGQESTCALTSKGGVLCWGSNHGNGLKPDSTVPVEVLKIPGE
jgi:alpha-tubulin suppressor-like RCC1 family protein